MAYIHKMTVYFVDPNEEVTTSEIENILDNDKWIPPVFVSEAETKEFEWDDDVIVNKITATKSDYETFYNSLN